MYQFVQTTAGWTLCWGPPPRALREAQKALEIEVRPLVVLPSVNETAVWSGGRVKSSAGASTWVSGMAS
jgi:hypothetical protein